MYLKHPSLVLPSDDTIIWRYMDFTKFFSLVNSSALYFPSAMQLAENDPYEGSFTKGDIEYEPGNDAQLAPLDLGQETFDLMKVNNKNLRSLAKEGLRKVAYINSWYISDYESAAMWKVYAEEKSGIAIRSSVGRLKDAVNAVEQTVVMGATKFWLRNKKAMNNNL